MQDLRLTSEDFRGLRQTSAVFGFVFVESLIVNEFGINISRGEDDGLEFVGVEEVVGRWKSL